MSFLDELREHLRAVEHGNHASPGAQRPQVNLALMRHHFLAALEREESVQNRLTHSLRVLHRSLSNGWFERFIGSVERELHDGLCAGEDVDTLHRHVRAAIDVLIDDEREQTSLSKLRALELARVAKIAEAYAYAEERGVAVARYAFENRLVRGSAARAVVSSLGRVLLDLPDADVVRWLLSIETQQSTGKEDAQHMHLDVLSAVLRKPKYAFYPDDPAHYDDDGGRIVEAEPWPLETMMFRRLCALGILRRWLDDEGAWGYDLVPAYRETLEDLVAGHRTPLSLLAESLLAEERGSFAGHAPLTASPEASFELQARHARMVVHEIRNTIVPMKMALSGLFRTLEDSAPEERWRSQRERVESGVARFLRFAGDLEQIVRIGAPTMQPFDLVAAVHDAIKGLNGGLGLTVTFEPDAELPRLVGHRAHFTLVVINVLRNAAQNNPQPGAAVKLTASQTAARDAVVLSIDDNGPGVPEEHRERIFRRGFALRLGGSGQGLALVREVVEREMRGAVRCESSDLGGARFILSFPLTPKESP